MRSHGRAFLSFLPTPFGFPLLHFAMNLQMRRYRNTLDIKEMNCLTFLKFLSVLCSSSDWYTLFSNSHQMKSEEENIIASIPTIHHTYYSPNPTLRVLLIAHHSQKKHHSYLANVSLLWVFGNFWCPSCSWNLFSSVARSCLTLCDPMDCSTPGLPVHHKLLDFIQTHVHWVHDAFQSSHPLSSPSPPAFNLSQHQGLFQWVNSSHQVAKVLKFQLQHQSFQWIFLRTNFQWIFLRTNFL